MLASLEKRIGALEASVIIGGACLDSSPVGLYRADGNLDSCFIVSASGACKSESEPEIKIPVKLKSFLSPKRYKVAYGGRGSAKTRSIVSILVERSRCKFERILCCREIQKSIQASSYQEIIDEIERRGLDDEFKVLENSITHKKTSSTFSFEGLYRNQTKIKGYAGATIAWVEEAEAVSQKSWDYLSPTIRADGSEIWISFNPYQETDPTWVEHVKPFIGSMEDGVYVGDDYAVVDINYTDNPWFPDELERERIKMMERDYDRYKWIWLGQFFDRSESQVLAGKWSVKEFKAPNGFDDFLYGMDFGFSNDPSAVTRVWVHDECLYVDYEAGGVGIPLDDHGKLIEQIPGAAKNVIRCDNARPETINHLSRMGYRTESAPKWPGSVEDGVEFLRSFKHIYIHPRCERTIEEASLWSYKVNKLTDDVLPKLDDKNNHYWDSIRYALSPLIKSQPNWFWM